MDAASCIGPAAGYVVRMKPGNLLTRRDMLKTLGAGAALVGLGAFEARSFAGETGTDGPQPFILPRLPYAYDALEPYFDARTMEIHHTKHHQAYIDKANAALEKYPELRTLTAARILQRLPDMPDKIRTALRNHVGGHANHTFFWQLLKPGAGRDPPTGALSAAIEKTFGSFEAFTRSFSDAASQCFGRGWAWLSTRNGELFLHATANQDSPLSGNATPVLGLDVWEHAYYLKYQNRRADYIAAFWKVVSWPQAELNYLSAT